MPIRERRKAPRVASHVPLTLTDATQEVSTVTHNISASGAYCTLSRFVAPMTKIRVRLELPGSSSPKRLICQGVVVRVEPPAPQPHLSAYRVAIFFQDLPERDRTILSDYVQRHQQP